MAKIIKQQIKRSMPWLVVLGTISAMVVGLVFNFDFTYVYDKVDGLDLSVDDKAVMAQNSDTASTTLEVLNAAPQFIVGPAENPISSSTSPRNEGGTIRFTASSSDAESNSIYLIVCTVAGVTASTTGGPPECSVPANELCVSALTPISNEAVCTHSGIADPPGETQAWFAYVCDNHATQGSCSTVSQGAGDSGSPFYINHAPSYTAVATTDDNKDPGNAADPFEVTASVVDNDSQGGDDMIELYVCRTDSFSTTTGCTGGAGHQLCYGASTTDDVSCTFATGTPADDDNFNYYAFVMDWHGFAGNSGNSRTNTYTVNNVAPTIGYGTTNLYSGGGATIQLDMRFNPEVYASTTSASVNDANGCTDLSHATSSIYWSSATNGYDCAADDDDCYQIGQATCEIAGCTGVGDLTASYTCSTTLAFHAIPTDAANGNPNSGTDWLGAIRVFDDDGLSGVGTTTAGRELDQLIALAVTEITIPYGIIQGGQNSGDANATTTVWNYGNTPIDSDVSGTEMDRNGGGGTIRDNNQEFNLTPFTYTGGTWNLSSTSPADVGITAPKPTTGAINVSDPIYWGIQVPVGTLSGDYYGENTFTSTADATEW